MLEGKVKMKKDILICVDRDGTLIYDKKYYLGKTNDWKKKIRFLKGVINGLKLLNKHLPKAFIYMITNQPGVAIKNFPLLTEKRVYQVFREVEEKLKKKGIRTNGFIICPHASLSYVKKHPRYKFYKKYVHSYCTCFKPNTGMIRTAIRKEGLEKEKIRIYVIGDRFSDVKMGLNAKGFGILVPFVNEPGQEEKVKEEIKGKGKKRVYIAKNFFDAARFIVKSEIIFKI